MIMFNKLIADVLVYMLYIWTWISFQYTKLLNFILLKMIQLPNKTIPTITPNSDINIKIIYAVDKNGNDISNKLILFMNFKWDIKMFDKYGGIDLDPFMKSINTEEITLLYCKDDIMTNLEFIMLSETVKELSAEFNSNAINWAKIYLNCININMETKIAHKLIGVLRTEHFVKSDILFGEIDFY